jgi:hypothetical protein
MSSKASLWVVFAILIGIGSYIQPSLEVAAADAQHSGSAVALLNSCGAYDLGCSQTGDPLWTDDNCYGTQCNDNPFGTDDNCYGTQCESDRVWWQDEDECLGSGCDDDPWNGSTTGCSFGVCEDDSILVNCSYVTVSASGAEGACDGFLGMTQFDNCYPVSGPGTMSGSNQQTFRCVDAPSYLNGGYSLTDIAPSSDEDVVHVLCSDANIPGMIDQDSCEGDPWGVKFHTCQQDKRISAPIGSDQEWYVCEK